jgi:DNA-directed RNA polymerase specialized sigma24 family protein
MTNEHSVSRWLDGVKAGDEASIERLWHRYFERLVRLARGKLPDHCRRAFDEEDVAISAFQSFCQRAAGGQFPKLNDRIDLWRLLLTLTLRKAVVTIRHQTRQKRGGGRVMGESALQGGNHSALGLAGLLEDEPSPKDVAAFAENVERRLGQLKDATLKKIALRRLEGYGVDEIATALGASTRTVERKLRLIRVVWEEETSR